MKTNLALLAVLLVIIASSLFATIVNRQEAGHQCPFKLCPFKGQETFDARACGCEIGSDCWALDVTHFDHPDWSYDQCEAFVFKPVY